MYQSIILAFVLSLDCFAISISQGLKANNTKKSLLILAICFGVFQAFMFLGGFYTGYLLFEFFSQFSKYISSALLLFIAVKMITEGFEKDEEEIEFNNFKDYIFLSIATSIDAFAAGISFNSINTYFIFTFIAVGLISFLMAVIGGFSGKKIGQSFGKYSEIFGGIILILLAFKTFFYS